MICIKIKSDLNHLNMFSWFSCRFQSNKMAFLRCTGDYYTYLNKSNTQIILIARILLFTELNSIPNIFFLLIIFRFFELVRKIVSKNQSFKTWMSIMLYKIGIQLSTNWRYDSLWHSTKTEAKEVWAGNTHDTQDTHAHTRIQRVEPELR